MASAAHAHPTGLTDICETFWNDFEHNLARRRYGFDISEAFVSSCAHETIVLEAVRNSKQSKAQRCRKLDVRFVSVDAVTTDTFFFYHRRQFASRALEPYIARDSSTTGPCGTTMRTLRLFWDVGMQDRQPGFPQASSDPLGSSTSTNTS